MKQAQNDDDNTFAHLQPFSSMQRADEKWK
jgi:hypothetical protein